MGLKDLFSRWTKGKDASPVEPAKVEPQMTPQERMDDTTAASSSPSSEAPSATDDDLHSP
jgi:hypothetical protein